MIRVVGLPQLIKTLDMVGIQEFYIKISETLTKQYTKHGGTIQPIDDCTFLATFGAVSHKIDSIAMACDRSMDVIHESKTFTTHIAITNGTCYCGNIGASIGKTFMVFDSSTDDMRSRALRMLSDIDGVQTNIVVIDEVVEK